MAGQQSIQAAVMRGEEVPIGHVVSEEWPKQTYAVGQADQELGQEKQRKGGHKTLPEEQASANLSSRERASSHYRPQGQEERASGQTA